MDERIKNELLARNEKIIAMVIERARKDFPDDIAIIGLTGSFSTGDFHEKSDLDLIIINDTPRGWEIGFCFILGDVGFDIYCTPWETRIDAESRLDSPMVSHLVDLKILYCAKPEHMARLAAYQKLAADELAKPIGAACVCRAKKDVELAKAEYANAVIAESPGAARYAAGGVLYNSINAIVSMNNTYIKFGAKRYLEELLSYEYLPDGFEDKYKALIRAKTVVELRGAALALLRGVDGLYNGMREKFSERAEPTYENLEGTYEELWCNYKNKVIASADSGDVCYAFHAALGAQNYLDEMTESIGAPKFDLMKDFDPDDLQSFKAAFLRAMDVYYAEYERVGRSAEIFDSFESLYERYTNTRR